jgi:acyl carrier protein
MTPETNSTLAQYIAATILKQPKRLIKPQDKLISSGLIDSFHLIDLAVFIEDTFGVRIDDTELNAETFDTLEQLVQIVESRRS